MIALPAPLLEPAAAARRVAAGQDPVWLSSPGAVSDTAIEFDLVAADPAERVSGDSVAAVEEAWRRRRSAWHGGGTEDEARRRLAPIPIAVGWLSYELPRQWVRPPSLLAPPPRGRAVDFIWPDVEFRFYDAVWIRRPGAPDATVWAQDLDAGARLLDRLSRPAPPTSTSTSTSTAFGPGSLGGFEGQGTRADYVRAVHRIKEYLRAGDVYQVNLSRRLVAGVSNHGPGGDPLWLAAALRQRTPAPHAVWMGSRSTPAGPLDRFIVGNSPERFLRVDGHRRVETRPIKGTRPRAQGPAADRALRAALRASPKDRAEHVMIVDLERNDLGRVAETGSVVCEDLLRVVELPTVYHLVSTIRAQLRSEVGLEALIRATFPGGSVTGAPKRRAMEIIDELEGSRRGIYTGATGWLGAGGELDLAVAIRTATVDRGVLSLSVGGGIVIDSEADDEWAETETKARAFLELAGRASRADADGHGHGVR